MSSPRDWRLETPAPHIGTAAMASNDTTPSAPARLPDRRPDYVRRRNDAAATTPVPDAPRGFTNETHPATVIKVNTKLRNLGAADRRHYVALGRKQTTCPARTPDETRLVWAPRGGAGAAAILPGHIIY